ncbi:unnamed protein product [Mesocestoides corti]|uniref:RNA helicase n=1 Tax=Mesocestoides corti TaxID=53468 RepID=A0A0R3U3M1_MESCO|nr:unnamed protein product [Mesocestoides corti]
MDAPRIKMAAPSTQPAKKPNSAAQKRTLAIGDLASLHRHLLGPSKTHRPHTSYGSQSAALPVIRLQPPPPTLLPPYPPPPPRRFRNISSDYTLPRLPGSLSTKAKPLVQRKRVTQKTQRRNATVSSVRERSRTSADACIGTECPDPKSEGYICRLCGFNCQTGDMLHAHLLLLRHTSINPTSLPGKLRLYDTNLSCRHCGVDWQLGKDETRAMNHPCLLQKAAYFKNILAPASKLRQGLPFVCLFCCAEEEATKTRRIVRRNPKKTLPLKRCHAAARFSSKLELAIHIRYVHDPTRESGHCPGCPTFVYDPPERHEPPEFAFWYPHVNEDGGGVAGPSPSPTRSTDSILVREGLHPLDRHISDTHTEGYEYLAWLNCKHHRAGPTDLAAKTTKSRTSWVYACPLCQLHPFSVHPKNHDLALPEVGMSSNAALQAHIACFHPAGGSFLDWKLQVCAVCGEAVASTRPRNASWGCHGEGDLTFPQQRHLLKRGHVGLLREQFVRAVRQGRILAMDVGEGVEWRNTCVLCWRRFEDDGKVNLKAECRLQAHLLSTHCIFNMTTSKRESCGKQDFNVLSCGWCGSLREDQKAGTNGCQEERVNLSGLQKLRERRKQSQAEVFADFQWSKRHEDEHAEAIFRWWRSSTRCGSSANYC